MVPTIDASQTLELKCQLHDTLQLLQQDKV